MNLRTKICLPLWGLTTLLLTTPVARAADDPLCLSPFLPTAERVVGLGVSGPYPLACPVVWGSETVWIAGARAVDGQDYVLDTSRGHLYFPRGLLPGVEAVVFYYRPAAFHPPGEGDLPREPARTGRAAPKAFGVARHLRADTRVLLFASPVSPPEEETAHRLPFGEERRWPYGAGALPALPPAGYGSVPPSPELRRLTDPRWRDFNRALWPSIAFQDQEFPTGAERFRHHEGFGDSQALLAVESRYQARDGEEARSDALALSILSQPAARWEVQGLLAQRDSDYGGLDARQTLALSRSLGSGMLLEGRVQHRESERDGEMFGGGLNLTTRVTPSSQASLGWTHAESERYGPVNSLNLDASARVTPRLQLQGNLLQRLSEQNGRLFSAGWALAARPFNPLQLEAGYHRLDAARHDAHEERYARLTLTPGREVTGQLLLDEVASGAGGTARALRWSLQAGEGRFLRVQGGRYDRRLPEPGRPGSLDGDLEVEAAPLEGVRIGYAAAEREREGAASAETRHEASIEVQPIRAITFRGRYRRLEDAADDFSVASVGGRLRLGAVADLEAYLRRQFRPDGAPEQRQGSEFQLGLTPLPAVRLFAGLTTRAEDDFQGLQDQNQRRLGMDLQLGSLALQGAISRLETGLGQSAGQEADLEMRLRLGNGSALFGGFRESDAGDLEPLRARSYRFGFRHVVNPDFFFLLEGEWSVYRDLAAASADRRARAQARLAVRF